MRTCRGGFRRPEPTRLSLPAFSPEALLALNQHVRRHQSGGGSRRDEAQASRAPEGGAQPGRGVGGVGGVGVAGPAGHLPERTVARRCGLSPGYLSLLMAGKRSPSPYTRRRRQQDLGVSEFEDLFIWETGEDQR